MCRQVEELRKDPRVEVLRGDLLGKDVEDAIFKRALGVRRYLRGMRYDDEENIIDGIALMRSALAILPRDAPAREELVFTLYEALVDYRRKDVFASRMYIPLEGRHTVDSEITRLCQEVTDLPSSNPRRLVFLKRIVHNMSLNYQSNPQEAIRICEEYMFYNDSEVSRRCEALAVLAEYNQFQASGDPNDAENAYNCATEALQLLDSAESDIPESFANRLRAVVHGILLTLCINPAFPYHNPAAAEQHRQLSLEFYDKACHPGSERRFTPEGVFPQDNKSRLSWARRISQSAMTDAMLFHQEGKLAEAIECIEEANYIFWSQTLRLHPRLVDSLPEEFRDSLTSLSHELESYVNSMTDVQGQDTVEGMRLAARIRRQTAAYERLAEQIRQEVPGYERFMLGDHFEYLKEAICSVGFFVILTCLGGRCYALYFGTRHSDERRGREHFLGDVHLKDLSPDQVNKLAGQFSQVAASGRSATEVGDDLPNGDVTGIDNISLAHDDVDTSDNSQDSDHTFHIDGSHEHPSQDRAGRSGRKRSTMKELLKDIWTAIVKPIFNELGFQPHPDKGRRRLWWHLTGQFTHIPVHAAGDYASPAGGCCSDYVISSYTPALRTLIEAKKSSALLIKKDAKLLLAAVSQPYRGASLGGTVEELAQVRNVVPPENIILLPVTDDTVTRQDKGASAQAILDALPEATIFHLASHGVQDEEDPFRSGFLMRDRKLALSELMQLDLPHAHVAFLSACETAKMDRGKDLRYSQFVNLSATMLHAGFKSVVGTMWRMSDNDGAHVAKAVYERLFEGDSTTIDPAVVAYALDEAIQAMRKQNVPPERWAPFIHIGV